METTEINMLKQILQDLSFLKKEIAGMKYDIGEIKDLDLPVKTEYLAKLDQIGKGKFHSRQEFDKIMSE